MRLNFAMFSVMLESFGTLSMFIYRLTLNDWWRKNFCSISSGSSNKMTGLVCKINFKDIVGACGQISLQSIRFSEFSYGIVFKNVSLRVKRTTKTHFRKALPQSPDAEFRLKSTDAVFPFVPLTIKRSKPCSKLNRMFLFSIAIFLNLHNISIPESALLPST